VSWNRCLTYASITAAFLLLTPILNPPARADAPNPLSATVNGQDVTTAVLEFGRPYTLLARAESGDPVTFTASGGCMGETTSRGAESSGILRVTFAGIPCVLAMTAAGEFAPASAQFTLPTVRGEQRARIPASTGPITLGTATRLGPRQIGTNQGLKVSWRVTQGRDRCSLALTRSSRVVRAGMTPGRCTVVATAPGVPGQYQPFRQTIRLTVR
jgi:hypothetical protein